jgi:hypothetical protein
VRFTSNRTIVRLIVIVRGRKSVFQEGAEGVLELNGELEIWKTSRYTFCCSVRIDQLSSTGTVCWLIRAQTWVCLVKGIYVSSDCISKVSDTAMPILIRTNTTTVDKVDLRVPMCPKVGRRTHCGRLGDLHNSTHVL